VLRLVLRRPLVSALVATAALGALALPMLRLHTQPESFADFTADIPAVTTARKVQEAYPGGLGPAVVVVRATDVTSPEVTAALADFKGRALGTGQFHEPFAVEVSPDRTVAVVTIGLSGTGADAASEKALDTLRGTLAPSLAASTGGTVAVTGETAESADFNDALARSLPLVFAFVLILTFLLMLVSFRSVTVAITTIGLNLLSVAAAYGLLVLVFQDGWGESLLDFTSTGGIVNWLPLFLFVILFGLSMDYHVFVLSRIREGHDRGLPTRQAVTEGIAGTAGVITSAAVVMVAVFGLFTTLPLVTLKQAGFGLAVAVLLDATVIRAVLLPAVMTLLGERNWWLPRWLSWLPAARPSESVSAAPVRAHPALTRR
jgi:RND superfamily putative drug exporter